MTDKAKQRYHESRETAREVVVEILAQILRDFTGKPPTDRTLDALRDVVADHER